MARTEPETGAPTGPRFTSDLLGQEAAEATLLDAWRSGRMHHAWLLTGPKGIGKATLAHRLARRVLAFPDPADPRAGAGDLAVDSDHPVVRRIRAGAFPDLVEIAATATETAAGRARPIIRVDEVRHGLGVLHATAGAGGWRVVIVDAADDMNTAAANAMLKGLEEPPPHTLFVLVSHAPGRLLPTIRSRCRRLQLATLGPEAIGRIAAAHLDEVPTGKALADLVALSGGSAGEAVRLAGEGGLELARELMQLLGSLPRLDLARLHRLAARLTAPKADAEFRIFAELLLAWLADAVRAAATGAPGRFAGLEPERGFGFPGGAALAPFAALWENLARAHGETLGLNLDRKQFLLNAFFALEATARGTASARSA
jgi:DNA polymerase-3 subunit delta'